MSRVLALAGSPLGQTVPCPHCTDQLPMRADHPRGDAA
jgi:hypothetical protein